MIRRLCICVVVFGLPIGFTSSVHGEEKKPKSIPAQVAAKRLKDTMCIVHHTKRVQPAHNLIYKEARIYFSSAAAMNKFKQNEIEFEPFANYQLVATGQYYQIACPLSGEEPNEDFATVQVGETKLQVLCADCAKDIAKQSLPEQIKYVFDAQGFKFGKFTRRQVSDAAK